MPTAHRVTNYRSLALVDATDGRKPWQANERSRSPSAGEPPTARIPVLLVLAPFGAFLVGLLVGGLAVGLVMGKLVRINKGDDLNTAEVKIQEGRFRGKDGRVLYEQLDVTSQ